MVRGQRWTTILSVHRSQVTFRDHSTHSVLLLATISRENMRHHSGHVSRRSPLCSGLSGHWIRQSRTGSVVPAASRQTKNTSSNGVTRSSRRQTPPKQESCAGQPEQPSPGSPSHGNTAGDNDSSSKSRASAQWPERMTGIQALMSQFQSHLQGGPFLRSSLIGVEWEQRHGTEQQLDELAQLAHADSRQISNAAQAQSEQSKLGQQQAAGAVDCSSTGLSRGSASEGPGLDKNDLLGTTEALKQAVSSAPGKLGSKQHELAGRNQSQQPDQVRLTAANRDTGSAADERILSPNINGFQQSNAAAPAVQAAHAAQVLYQAPSAVASEQLQQQLQEAQEQLAEANADREDSQQLRMEYDIICQRVYQLSRKLTLADSERSEAKRELEDAKAQMASTAVELAEHRELQMQYDKLCQDMYRLRMSLQQAQAHSSDLAAQAARADRKHKRDIAWLMEAHRRELQEAHNRSQELTQDAQQLRMRLLEREQQIWSHSPAGGSSSKNPAAAAAAAVKTGEPASSSAICADSSTAAEAPADSKEQQTAALSAAQQQKQHLEQLESANHQLLREKQQLARSLQELQREQAVMLVELQQLMQQQQATQQRSTAAPAVAVADAKCTVAQQSAVEKDLAQRLQDAMQQRSSLVQQVQELQQQWKQDAERSTASGAVVAADGPAAAEAAAVQLQDSKAQLVQLRGQLVNARRELQLVSSHAQRAEAALKQQSADYQERLAHLQASYGKQAAVLAQIRKGKFPGNGQVGFTNKNRYWVRQEQLYDFVKHWVAREAFLSQQPGFLGLKVEPVMGVSADGGVNISVSSLWESIPHWEAWSKSDTAQQQHMPNGVYQYVPKKGEGFPDDFVPFRELEEAVNAKY